jgi:hypothetical protein
MNDDGSAELFAGNACPSYIGRLPWKTLGLPDLRDESGERLWYALSPNYRDNAAVEPLNSAKPGQIAVAGTQPAAGLVALIIAPGTAVARAGAAAAQTRGCTVGVNCDANLACTLGVATPKCNPVNYLETSGGIDNADGDFNYASAVESESFNDRHLEISVDDIMSLVEKRAGRELSTKLRAHFDAWQNTTNVVGTKGFYPWAAPFNDPATASPGVNDTQTGQLPMSAGNVVWSSASFTLGVCAGVNTNTITCSGIIACVVTCLAQINARVSGIGTAFVDPPDGSEVTLGGLLLGGSPTGTWTLNPGAQALDFNYSGGSIVGVGLVTVTVKVPAATAWAISATSTDWLVTNNWAQVSHYSVAPRYAITGTNACGGAGTCITVAGATNSQAVVTMTGRALAGQARTVPATLAAYLEGGNQDPTDLVLERNLRTPVFNDQPIIVRP